MTPRCLPKPIQEPPATPRRGLVVALVPVALVFVGVDAWAQATGSGFTITRFWDGTNIINAGDNANNAVRVNVVAGSAGGPSKVDDAAFTVATDSVAPIGMMADQTTPDSVNEGDVGIPRMLLNRIPLAALWDAAGNERGANVTAASQLEVSVTAALPAGTNNIGDVDVLTLPALPAGTNNIGDVDVASMPSASSANNDGAQVSVTTASTAVLASFSTRKQAIICAAPTNTAVIHIKLGATATTSDGKLWVGQCVNTGIVPYTGAIDGIAASGTQEVTVWEW